MLRFWGIIGRVPGRAGGLISQNIYSLESSGCSETGWLESFYVFFSWGKWIFLVNRG